jgi:hypothetical protein
MKEVIPRARAEMQAVADGEDLDPARYKDLIRDWIPGLRRRPPVRRAVARPPRSRQTTKVMKAKALRLVAEHPELGYQEIAYRVGIRNIGRVSEWVAGFPDGTPGALTLLRTKL